MGCFFGLWYIMVTMREFDGVCTEFRNAPGVIWSNVLCRSSGV
jgi:hypothetical protein